MSRERDQCLEFPERCHPRLQFGTVTTAPVFDSHRELGPPQQAKRYIREIFIVTFLNQTDQSLQATDVRGSRRALPRQVTRKRTEFRRGKSLPLHNLEEFMH